MVFGIFGIYYSQYPTFQNILGHSWNKKRGYRLGGAERESDCSHESRHRNEVPNSDLQYCIRNKYLVSVSMFSLSSFRGLYQCLYEGSVLVHTTSNSLIHRRHSDVLPIVSGVWETSFIYYNTRDLRQITSRVPGASGRKEVLDYSANWRLH